MKLNKSLTLGSLFSGSGGFELGGLLAGITPVWASEIEPFPIRVTTRRFPSMKHYGDITRMEGGKIEPVDIITFGSPCTDMSCAGKRAGLNGPQSSLFYQAIRIITEMRCATNGQYPRWICWENVVGAYSSNQGRDFQKVLEEIISIIEPGTQVPMPPKDRWPYADIYLGDGWSIAYRTFDAQYWGVAQRRRRIYLVGDLAGRCAGKVLFESEGVSGYSPQGFRAWQRAAGNPAAGLGAASPLCLNDQGGSYMDVSVGVSGTLRAQMDGHPPCILEQAAGVYENHSQDTRYTGPLDTAPTVSSTYGTGGNNQPFVVEADTPKTLKIRAGRPGGGKGPLVQEDMSATLSCNNDQTLFVPKTYAVTTGSYTQVSEEQAPTLMARDFKDPAAVKPAPPRLQIHGDWFGEGVRASALFHPALRTQPGDDFFCVPGNTHDPPSLVGQRLRPDHPQRQGRGHCPVPPYAGPHDGGQGQQRAALLRIPHQ